MSNYSGHATLQKVQKLAAIEKKMKLNEKENFYKQPITPKRKPNTYPSPNSYFPVKQSMTSVQINKSSRPKSVFDVPDNHLPAPNNYNISLPKIQQGIGFPRADRFRLNENQQRVQSNLQIQSSIQEKDFKINQFDSRKQKKVNYLDSRLAPNTYFVKWKDWK